MKLKLQNGKITEGLKQIVQQLCNPDEQLLNYIDKIEPIVYQKCPTTEEVQQLVKELPDQSDNSLYAILLFGSPYIAPCYAAKKIDDKFQLNQQPFFSNKLYKQSYGQVSVAFKKYQQELEKKMTANQPEFMKNLILENAEYGHVVTRFPPEPSGFLHIGHSKAALLNYYFAKKYNGKMLFRLDDTNPSKENPEFVENIKADLKRLGITYDSMSYTSDHFPQIQEFCEKLIKEGKAYCDNTPQEQMQKERNEGIESVNRNTTPEENLAIFEEMKAGTEKGQTYCVRAKCDMQNTNKCLRDFVIYRCNVTTPHWRTGTTYKCYPTYDFACPIVDSVEGVTHALRTVEFHDRNAQYAWVCQQLGLRCPTIQDFSRLRLQYTLMSKRQLQWFVNNKIVSDWTDPRFPTVQGLQRRGLLIESLRDFVLQQGASKKVNYQEWSKLWALNKQKLEKQCIRLNAVVSDYKEIKIENAPEQIEVALHPKRKELGNKVVKISGTVLVNKSDADTIQQQLQQNITKVTMMGLGNCQARIEGDQIILKYTPEDQDYNKTFKFTWINKEDKLIPITMNYYSQICTKAIIDADDDFTKYVNKNSLRIFDGFMNTLVLNYIKTKDIIQIERFGFYYIEDIKEDGSIVMNYVNEGKLKCQVGAFEFDEDVEGNDQKQ